jgi:hypothetical protein
MARTSADNFVWFRVNHFANVNATPIKMQRLLSISTMRVPVPGGVGGGERPHNVLLVKHCDETMAFSKRLAMIGSVAKIG